MNRPSENKPLDRDELTIRRSYEKPRIARVDLALAETLSEGCKLETNPGCIGPPITALEGGS